MQNFYITTPIFYVNDVPHIGHAYTSIACDVIARFKRLNGSNVRFLPGCDEHGQKIEKSALTQQLSPQDFVNKYSQTFRVMMERLNISEHDFIRTTEERHKNGVRALWQKLQDNGFIYEGKYAGWYSTRDEAFYQEKDLSPEGLAPTGAPVEWIEEPSYFFALSKFQDKLLAHFEANPDFIAPESARNEIINFIKGGLSDLSISRSSFDWGIKVPNDPNHVIYVWLDALTNYISALGYPDMNEDFSIYWPSATHVIGKDIVRFHAIFWPAFLMGSGLPLPKKILVHGWWTNEGEKISKSLGNTIDPLALIEKYGLDAVRYFLMREITFGKDGNFAHSNLITRVNSELANKVGNLLQRVSSFAFKECEQAIANISQAQLESIYNTDLLKLAQNTLQDNINAMDKYALNQILDNIINLAEEANLFMDQEAPWSLKKTDRNKMNEVLYTLLEVTRYIAIMLQPFTPDSAEKMLNQLNVPTEERNFEHLSMKFAIKAGSEMTKPTPIFPRLDK